MKLAVLHLEAKIDPSLIPALNRMTNKLVKAVRAAGVEMMVAKTPLTHDLDWRKTYHDEIKNAADRKSAEEAGKPLPDKLPQSRWDSRSRGVGGPIWLVGYIKRGPTWLSIWLTLQGGILAREQNAYSHGISEHHFRAFENTTDLIHYLKGGHKAFVEQEPLQRFMGYIKNHLKRNMMIQYHEPPKPPKTGEGLDDEDEFGSRFGSPKHQYSGMTWAASELAKAINKGESFDPDRFAIVLSASDIKHWVDKSGINVDIDRNNDNYWVQLTPDGVFYAGRGGDIGTRLELPTELDNILTNIARNAGNKVVKLAQAEAEKIKKNPPRTMEQRLLDAIRGEGQ